MTAWHELARISAERMLNGVAEGVVIALLAGVLLQVMRRQNLGRRNSGTRFAVLLAALLSIAALPVLTVVRASVGASISKGAVWAVTVPSLWATYAVLGWAAIALVGLARVGLGLWQLQKVRAGSEVVDLAMLDVVLQKTLGEFHSRRQVTIAISEKVMVPAAIGFFRPMIVLPSWALRELSTAELNSILIHELAHLQRRDDWTNLAQKVLRAALFFHPGVWWVERQLSLEREMACDDVVLARTENPRAYAECLVTVAERSLMRRGLALAQAAVSKKRQTTLRVAQILDGSSSTATRVWKPALGLVTAVSGIFVVALARAPELVAFRESAPVVASTALVPTPLASVVVPTSLPTSFAKPILPKAVLTSFRYGTEPSRKVTARPIQARVMLPQSAQPIAKATLASLKQGEASAQTLFVVMRTEQVGPEGASWTIRVWQFTVLKPEQIPAGLKVPAKST
ncbi:MAG TPA: M56 family metallopeptidase [Terriglobales bacterium]|jgi:beta-lactamase regulating signal transducer with metallopeptidase domain|nr:M56 family metallopeptidase [Terriglobales bacterium]